ncbi:TIGR03746 family integrating conjugative element protein [Lampropedia puyangensis]|uniref:TIGR03746 family integrating conjugative element protein n=1 Tax=Lampropedia puyangensis TaxID=1330072 RepID=A0A4V4GQI6_9BURK|nr:TIGR03746 family integrating conjugative element protein [Lampropedia puyangensis]THT98405.1 TIGR03746 family integrating conjugative element protein [Lampropedia puyangensis]
MKTIDALENARRENALLVKILGATILMGALGMYLLSGTPKNISVHLAPDMRAGETIDIRDGLSPVPTTNVYGFAYYIWQQVNRWQEDGNKDYGQQIFALQAYLTPRCRAQLLADMENRSKKGELRQRTRLITEIPGFGYAANRVLPEGNSAWQVLLDMQLIEEYRGHSLKDVFIRYPIRVVRYDVDRERNPWALALDCFGASAPTRISAADVQAGGKNTQDVVTPMSLPRATNQSVDPMQDLGATTDNPASTASKE